MFQAPPELLGTDDSHQLRTLHFKKHANRIRAPDILSPGRAIVSWSRLNVNPKRICWAPHGPSPPNLSRLIDSFPETPSVRHSHHCVVAIKRPGTFTSTKIPSPAYITDLKEWRIGVSVAAPIPHLVCARVIASPKRAKCAGSPLQPNGITR